MSDYKKQVCQMCGTVAKYYDSVLRIVRSKARKTRYIKIPRFRCPSCGGIHRELPEIVLPYKQYELEIIQGVIEGLITCETYGFEDYPCEMTMTRWRQSQNIAKVALSNHRIIISMAEELDKLPKGCTIERFRMVTDELENGVQRWEEMYKR